MSFRTAALLLVVFARPTLAQIAPDTARLVDRAVTATKTKVEVGIAPAATTVLFGDELRAQGMVFVTDALKSVPSLMVVGNGSYGAITSIFLRGGESDYVKVLLDGVPLNQPGGSIYLADLSLDNIDRIEIVRGPVTVLHGADAVSGVIQLFTRKGTPGSHPDLSASRGTFDNSQYALGIGARKGPWGYSAAASQFRSDGTYLFNSNYQNRVASLNIDQALGTGRRFAANARYGDAIAHFPTDYTGIAIDSNQFTRARTFALGLSGSTPLNGSRVIALSAFVSRLNNTTENRPDSPGDSVGYAFEADRGAITSRLGFDGRMDFLAANGGRFSLGIGYERENEEQTSRTVSNFDTGAFTETGSFKADRGTKSLYGQWYAIGSPWFTLQLGGRIDRNSAFGTFATWRVGASVERKSGVRFWAAAGSAFKAPTFSELFAQGAFEIGNPDLDPERSTSFEAGIGRVFVGGRGSFSVTAFTQRFRELIQYVSAVPGVSNYQNLTAASSRGVELVLAYRLNSEIDLKGNWSLLRTEVTDTGTASSDPFVQGERLLRRPASSGALTARFRSGRATLSAVVNFIGERDDVDYRGFPALRTTLPSYRTTDLSLEWPVRAGNGRDAGLDLIFRGENVFDVAYEQVVAFPGRGRTLFFGGRLHR